MYDLGKEFKIDQTKLVAPDDVVFKGKKYRITVLSERLIRLEFNSNGFFNDHSTTLVSNRVFKHPQFIQTEDNLFLIIETKYFKLSYLKDASFSGKTLYASIPNTKNMWYYGDKEVRNFEGSAISIDKSLELPRLSKSLFATNGIVTLDDSKSLCFDENSNIVTNSSNIDLYLFIYGNDFGLCLNDYFNLTGFPEMIPRYALGNWWSKDYAYKDTELLDLINKFNLEHIPLSTVVLDREWAKKDLIKYNYVDTGFSFNGELFPDPNNTIKEIHDRKLKIGLKINPYYGFYPFEKYFNTAAKYFNPNKQGYIDFNLNDPRSVDMYLKIFLQSLINLRIDMFWCDYNSKNNNDIYLINYYMQKYLKKNNMRSLVLSRNSNIAGHRNNILYSGPTVVDWKTLKMLPFYNLSSSNIGLSWWSHDVGGSIDGIEDSDLYLRSLQFGVFSPILRFNTEKGRYFKREPWQWDMVTNNIATYYLQLRHRLIPYIYSEAYKYHKVGNPLITPFYYTNLNMYDNPIYVNQYYFGNSFMISPIINQMDEFINRTVQRFYMPDGVWYDFKNGKRFLGNHKYLSFYRIEDYPIFVRAGSVIPLAGENSYMNVGNPTDLDIHVFPGKNNTYHLYEDDGETYDYEKDKCVITEIDYNYRSSNYTVIIRRLRGEENIIPTKRDYKIIFRNTKKADNVVVYFNNTQMHYETEVTEKDFKVIVHNVPTNGQLVINCYGKDIEIDALQLIKDDIDSILFDLKINTKLKDEIASIVFGDKTLSKKRIAIRKLKKYGLDKRSIKIFLKLLEYMEM